MSKLAHPHVDNQSPFQAAWSLELTTHHQQLLQGNPQAPEIISRLLLFPLIDRLAKRYRHVDREAITDAVTDALVDYFSSPHRFQANIGIPVEVYLLMAAKRNLLNYIRSESRRSIRHASMRESYLDCYVSSNSTASDQNVNLAELLAELKKEFINPVEWRILCAWMDGERKVEPYARLLGVSQLSAAEQAHLVKCTKDRLLHKLRRLSRKRPKWLREWKPCATLE